MKTEDQDTTISDAFDLVSRLSNYMRVVISNDLRNIDSELTELHRVRRLKSRSDFQRFVHNCEQTAVCLASTETNRDSSLSVQVKSALGICQDLLRRCEAELDDEDCVPGNGHAHLMDQIETDHAGKNSPVGKVIFDSHGVRATLLSEQVLIILPPVATSDHRDEIIEALDNIEQLCPNNAAWVVDISALEQIPIRLVGTLVASLEDRRDRGRHAAISGTHPNLAKTKLDLKLQTYVGIDTEN